MLIVLSLSCQRKALSCDGLRKSPWCDQPQRRSSGMSFFERYNAAVERYQTTRNTMIAQATCGMAPGADFMRELHNNIRLELKKFGYANAELCLDAFEDFLKGPSFIKKPCFEIAGKIN